MIYCIICSHLADSRTGFDGNVRDITKSVYNDPDDPNPKKLTMASYPLTSYDKRQLKAAVRATIA